MLDPNTIFEALQHIPCHIEQLFVKLSNIDVGQWNEKLVFVFHTLKITDLCLSIKNRLKNKSSDDDSSRKKS